MKNFLLNTVDADGTLLQYRGSHYIKPKSEYDQKHQLYCFRILDKDDDCGFEFDLAEIDKLTFKVDMMIAHSINFRRKGIPEALILFAIKEFGKTIESSSNNVTHKILRGEKRDQCADKYWLRLQDQTLAYKDDLRDIFVCPAI